MQVDVEMFLAASPPMFSSPLVAALDTSFYRSSSTSLYAAAAAAAANSSASFTSSLNHYNSSNRARYIKENTEFRSTATSATLSLYGRRAGRCIRPLDMSSTPLRSCLVIRPEGNIQQQQQQFEDLSLNGNSSDERPRYDSSSSTTSFYSSDSDTSISPQSPGRCKKKVVFADDKGLSLTQVKLMTEPSDCPPRWTAEFLEQVTRGASAEVAADRWEITFPQPASDYLDFRSRLDQHNISLENIVVQEGDQQLVGTVKVKNLSFNKQVDVRITFDRWISYQDIPAVYVPSGLQGANGSTAQAVNLFDTFSFKITIPPTPTLNQLEFCLRFQSDAGEFWDNNQGKNYILVKPDLPKVSSNSPTLSNKAQDRNGNNGVDSGVNRKYTDALVAKVDSWSEFASWNHLVNDAPYW